jgi:hypothetical protein
MAESSFIAGLPSIEDGMRFSSFLPSEFSFFVGIS